MSLLFAYRGVVKTSANIKYEQLYNETLAQVFSCEFCEISKNTFSYRTWWLPLYNSKDRMMIVWLKGMDC